MKLLVNVTKPVARDVSVKFRGADGGVAEHFLDNAQIGAMLEEMRGETVAKHVRRDVSGHAGESDALLDAGPHGDRGKR